MREGRIREPGHRPAVARFHLTFAGLVVLTAFGGSDLGGEG